MLLSGSWQTKRRQKDTQRFSFIEHECEQVHTHAHVLPRLTYWLTKMETSAAQVLRVLPSPALILYSDPHMEGCL